MRALIVAITLVITALGVTGASAQVAAPPAPTNLEVIAHTDHSVTIAWGPSKPGAFYRISGVPNHTSLVVGWGASQDSRSAVTYRLTKNGHTLASTLAGTSYRLRNLRGRTSFTTCVTARNAADQSSPPTCATWSR